MVPDNPARTEEDQEDASQVRVVFPDQTIFSSEGVIGNCFQACLAGVLGVKIEAVPHFALLGMMHWMQCCVTWLGAEHKLFINTFKDDALGDPLPYHIINGYSPRMTRHAVIGDTRTGKMIHDPHQSRAGLSHINSRFYFFKELP